MVELDDEKESGKKKLGKVSGEGGGAPMECVHIYIYIRTRYSILLCSTWTRFDLNKKSSTLSGTIQ